MAHPATSINPEVARGVRAIILFIEVSLHELFQRRTQRIIIHEGPATEPSSKVKDIAPPDSSSAVVDLTTSVIPQSITFVSDPRPGRCKHCLRMTKEGRVGIPVKMRDDKFHHTIIVDIEERACNYSCAYSFLRDKSHLSIYSGRIYILKKIFELSYPGKELKAAPDPSLHKDHEGEMDDERFDSGARSYIPVPFLKYRLCSIVYEGS